jgi:hypothetical protein
MMRELRLPTPGSPLRRPPAEGILAATTAMAGPATPGQPAGARPSDPA